MLSNEEFGVQGTRAGQLNRGAPRLAEVVPLELLIEPADNSRLN